jgi:hypothetical protein
MSFFSKIASFNIFSMLRRRSKRSMVQPVVTVSSVPTTERILPPRPYHINWPASRARHFAQIVSGNPKRRGTYDQNIRILNDAYSRLVGSEAHPRAFIQKVNPLIFARLLGWSDELIKVTLRGSAHELWIRASYSKCEHCRTLAGPEPFRYRV